MLGPSPSGSLPISVLRVLMLLSREEQGKPRSGNSLSVTVLRTGGPCSRIDTSRRGGCLDSEMNVVSRPWRTKKSVEILRREVSVLHRDLQCKRRRPRRTHHDPRKRPLGYHQHRSCRSRKLLRVHTCRNYYIVYLRSPGHASSELTVPKKNLGRVSFRLVHAVKVFVACSTMLSATCDAPNFSQLTDKKTEVET